MARTLDEWQAYVASLMQAWRNGPVEQALQYGIAKVFQGVEAGIASKVAETYLENSTGTRLDQYGHERGVERIVGETDATYRGRIRSFTGVTANAIMAAIDAALSGVLGQDPTVTYELYELYPLGPWCDDCWADTFYPAEVRPYNMFLIEFQGVATTEQKEAIYSAAVAAVSKAKAFGVMFDVVSYL